MGIAKSNIIYMCVIVAIYITIDVLIFTEFWVMIILQLIIIGLAVSPVGEWIIRLFYGCRPVVTQQDYDKVAPMFSNVYEQVYTQYPGISKNIGLYIDDTLTVNAYAIGRSTIAVTRGALETLTEDEMRGILAHEFGHIVRGDTLLFPVLLVGNLMLLVIMGLKAMIKLVVRVSALFMNDYGVSEIISIFLDFIVYVFISILQVLLLVHSRADEYDADLFAYDLGYGNELTKALYSLERMNMGSTGRSLLDKLKDSHPNIHKRIERLESFKGSY